MEWIQGTTLALRGLQMQVTLLFFVWFTIFVIRGFALFFYYGKFFEGKYEVNFSYPSFNIRKNAPNAPCFRNVFALA